MESFDADVFRKTMNSADLITSDGMPLVWGLRLLGVSDAQRVYGPDLTPLLLSACENHQVSVGFYGASQEVINSLKKVISYRWPRLDVPYWYSPPFRPLTDEEDAQITKEINASGARILFVGLSSPKQEYWMKAHRGRISSVMLGVGAAFDFLGGTKPQAPRWMMAAGLEWLFRLMTEPRRLWKRYLKHNPRFVCYFMLQLLGWRRSRVSI